MDGFVTLVVVVLTVWIFIRLVRYIRKERYFASEKFASHKTDIASVVAEHNEVGQYTSEISAKSSFQIGASYTGSQAHLASFRNTSQWNYRRDRNVANYRAANVHNCSLQVARNASADPIKYVMKYFNIKANEQTLEDVERLNESIVRLEEALNNLHQREVSITQSVNPPHFILKHYAEEFMQRVGVELAPISVPTPCTSLST